MHNAPSQDAAPVKLKIIAGELDKPLSTIRRWCRQDQLPHIRFSSRDYRVRRADLQAWLTARTRGPAISPPSL